MTVKRSPTDHENGWILLHAHPQAPYFRRSPSSVANSVPAKPKPGDGRLEKIIERSVYDLTVFKVHFGRLTLKMYDKGDRVLRVESGKRLEKLPGMLQRLQGSVVALLDVVQAGTLELCGRPATGCFGRAECAG